jgi:hypothetical protein
MSFCQKLISQPQTCTLTQNGGGAVWRGAANPSATINQLMDMAKLARRSAYGQFDLRRQRLSA